MPRGAKPIPGSARQRGMMKKPPTEKATQSTARIAFAIQMHIRDTKSYPETCRALQEVFGVSKSVAQGYIAKAKLEGLRMFVEEAKTERLRVRAALWKQYEKADRTEQVGAAIGAMNAITGLMGLGSTTVNVEGNIGVGGAGGGVGGVAMSALGLKSPDEVLARIEELRARIGISGLDGLSKLGPGEVPPGSVIDATSTETIE